MNRHETKKKTSEKKERKDKTETANVYTTRPGVVGSANVQVGKKDLKGERCQWGRRRRRVRSWDSEGNASGLGDVACGEMRPPNSRRATRQSKVRQCKGYKSHVP